MCRVQDGEAVCVKDNPVNPCAFTTCLTGTICQAVVGLLSAFLPALFVETLASPLHTAALQPSTLLVL